MTSIITELKNQVYYIWLNRPEVYNGFNMEMSKEVQKALDFCATSEEVRAIVISAKGKAFSSGQDLKEATAENAPSMETILTEQYNPILLKIKNCPKPVIAAVQGVAAGAGANIALACDIVLASKSACFIQAFSKIGLVPDSGGTYYLPRLVGLQNAMALMMTGDKINAEDALRMGMIYKMYDDESFDAEVEKFSTFISQMPTKALAYTKKLLYLSLETNLEKQLLNELEYQKLAGDTHDFKEGVNSFIEKRKPVFNGK
ncbi:MAG: 2-(1,2-epoxy-1,2-dihydrophenyl)acetyl-CoA isomerase [Saprospiraceae bacterium]|nr:2-(1,2-epoxy-1,2-dihydrophenyl)acetyl-CoA isomerase [Saprospiraceae bacterium]